MTCINLVLYLQDDEAFDLNDIEFKIALEKHKKDKIMKE